MKKTSILKSILLISLCIMGVNSVNADNAEVREVDGTKEVLVCKYTIKDEDKKKDSRAPHPKITINGNYNRGGTTTFDVETIQLRYRLQDKDTQNEDKDGWYLCASYIDTSYNQNKEKLSCFSGPEKFLSSAGDNNVAYRANETPFTQDQLSNFGSLSSTDGCPKYVNIGLNMNRPYPCLGDNEWCTGGYYEKEKNTKFFSLPYTSGADVFNEIKSIASDVFNSKKLKCDEKNNTDQFNKTIALTIEEEFSTRYSGYKLPNFVKNYIEKKVLSDDEVKSAREKFEAGCDNQKRRDIEEQKAANQKQVELGLISQQECDERNAKLDEQMKNYLESSQASSTEWHAQYKTNIPIHEIREGDDCNALLGGKMTKVIKNIFRTIQYAGPVLVFLLSAVDFLKAVTSGNQEDMKKATSKLGKRVAAAILLFFVPMICELLLTVTGIIPENIMCTLE